MPKSILITGCSSGIGLSVATHLKQKNYRVFATARKPEDVETLRKNGFESFLLDVNNRDSMEQALADILKLTKGTLDALFNNAGFALAGAIEDLSRDMMRSQFETNVFGAMELTNLVIPIMRQQGHGRIIQNTSILGLVAMPYRGAYAASKFAFEGFSNSLRQELHGTNIYVSNLVLGPISSELRKNSYKIYQTTLQQKKSLHQKLYQSMEKYFFNVSEEDRKFTLKPDAVIPKIIHALESTHPKAHYYVSAPAHVFAILRRFLPDMILDWLMIKISREEGKIE